MINLKNMPVDEKKNPLVSIITVSYNSEKTIEKTIQSVLEQSYPQIEYIIIDGNSTDGTLDIINRYEEKISYFVSEPDKNMYDAMNKGIKKASGELIAILNSDDMYYKDTVKKAVNAWVKVEHKDNCVIYGDMLILQEDSTCNYVMKADVNYLKKNMRMNHPTWFVSKDVYKKYGMFDIAYRTAADYDFALRVVRNNVDMTYIPESLTQFKDGGASAINFKAARDVKEIRKKNNCGMVMNEIYYLSECFGLFISLLKKEVVKTKFGFFLRRRISRYRNRRNLAIEV
jgi:glycosyltransferase involved in cell wall biosynthesis